MGTLYADDDHVLVPAVKELAKSPGLAESGVGIEKEIMAVPEISDGIARVCAVIVVRKIDMKAAGLGSGCVPDRIFYNHLLYSLSLFLRPILYQFVKNKSIAVLTIIHFHFLFIFQNYAILTFSIPKGVNLCIRKKLHITAIA